MAISAFFATVDVYKYGARGTNRSLSFGIQHWADEEGVNEMNPGWSPAQERAATLGLNKQPTSARPDTGQAAIERKPTDKSMLPSPLIRFLY